MTDQRSLAGHARSTSACTSTPYGRHAREPGPSTALLPLAAHNDMQVRVNGRYVVLTFTDGRRPVFLAVHEADSLASAILKAAREAIAAEVA